MRGKGKRLLDLRNEEFQIESENSEVCDPWWVARVSKMDRGEAIARNLCI